MEVGTSRDPWVASLVSRDSGSPASWPWPFLPILANLLAPRSRLLRASRAVDFSESREPLLRLLSRDCRSFASLERGWEVSSADSVADSAGVESASEDLFSEFNKLPPFPPPLKEASLEEPLRADSFPAGLLVPSSSSSVLVHVQLEKDSPDDN